MTPHTQPMTEEERRFAREWHRAMGPGQNPLAPSAEDVGPDRSNGGIDWLSLNREFS
jgi:hypothetical protein